MSTIEVEIGEILVAPGDRVEPSSPVMSVAADKVDFEIEAGVAGVVEAVLVAEGDVAQVGDVVVTIAAD